MELHSRLTELPFWFLCIQNGSFWVFFTGRGAISVLMREISTIVVSGEQFTVLNLRE